MLDWLFPRFSELNILRQRQTWSNFWRSFTKVHFVFWLLRTNLTVQLPSSTLRSSSARRKTSLRREDLSRRLSRRFPVFKVEALPPKNQNRSSLTTLETLTSRTHCQEHWPVPRRWSKISPTQKTRQEQFPWHCTWPRCTGWTCPRNQARQW